MRIDFILIKIANNFKYYRFINKNFQKSSLDEPLTAENSEQITSLSQSLFGESEMHFNEAFSSTRNVDNEYVKYFVFPVKQSDIYISLFFE